jgi:hypothetical protein
VIDLKKSIGEIFFPKKKMFVQMIEIKDKSKYPMIGHQGNMAQGLNEIVFCGI